MTQKPHKLVSINDVLTLPINDKVKILKIIDIQKSKKNQNKIIELEHQILKVEGSIMELEKTIVDKIDILIDKSND